MTNLKTNIEQKIALRKLFEQQNLFGPILSYKVSIIVSIYVLIFSIYLIYKNEKEIKKI